MRSYPRILFLAWMLVALIGIALSAPQVPSAPIAGHGAAKERLTQATPSGLIVQVAR